MRSAVLDEATALQWRSRRLSHILRAWKEVVTKLRRSQPSCSRVQSLRSERFFGQWLKSYRLSKFAARRAGETPELWLCAAFTALGSYARMRREKQLQRRKAQRCRWQLLLRFASQGLRRGVERARYCRTEAERLFSVKARSLEEQLFCLWQNLVDFTRNDRASALRTQHLLMKAFQGFKRYRQDRLAKASANHIARSYRQKKLTTHGLVSLRSHVQLRQQVAIQRSTLHQRTRLQQLQKFLACWHSWTSQCSEHMRQCGKIAGGHRVRTLCSNAFQLWSFRCQCAGHCRRRVIDLQASCAQQVVHEWLLHWRTAVVSWREMQRKDRKALVQWYVVLISSTLKGWRNWCNDRRVKKQRQEEATQLFLGAARRWSLAALFRCHEERQSFAEQVAEQEWELLAQKRATLAVAAANRWRQKLYLRSKWPSYVWSQEVPEMSFDQELHLSLTPSEVNDWPSPI